ncbi:hypothetical protein Tco_0236366 [Tanacetum coccineum]
MPEDNTNQVFQPALFGPLAQDFGIGNNPTFDAANTSQPALSVYVVGVSQVHLSGDPMPNVDTPCLLVDVVGAHTMAPPNDRIQNNSVDNNLPTHVGSSVRQSVPSGQPPEYMHFEACNETCQHYAISAPPKFHRTAVVGNVCDELLSKPDHTRNIPSSANVCTRRLLMLPQCFRLNALKMKNKKEQETAFLCPCCLK